MRYLPAMFDPAFLRGETWGFPQASVEHIETHAAHVFLVDGLAFKIKKDVKLPYLDFSSVGKRRAVLEHELEINRPFAPAIYRSVDEVRGEPVLVMNRFPATALLSWQIGQRDIGRDLAIRLADMLAHAHGVAPPRDVPGVEIMTGLGAQLSGAFTDSPDIFAPAETLEFHAHYAAALRQHRHLLNSRSAAGLVRRCHGDLHCGNIAVLDDGPVLFDAIEFSEKIATIDVLYDLAFLLMDLLRHGQHAAANTVLNRYFHMRRADEDLSGLALLPLFLSTRSGVRALVTADLVHEQPVTGSAKPRGIALDYFRASLAYLKPEKPRLVCVGGLSGTGKTTLAAAIAPDLKPAPGALHVRTDVERKLLAGVAETDRLPSSGYTPAASAQVYHAVLQRAGAALAAGHSVIVDAVFASEAERHDAEQLAAQNNAAFHGIWLEAPPGVMKQRVTARRDDASDADHTVVERQLSYDLGRITWPRIDASGEIGATCDAVRRTVLSPPAGPA